MVVATALALAGACGGDDDDGASTTDTAGRTSSTTTPSEVPEEQEDADQAASSTTVAAETSTTDTTNDGDPACATGEGEAPFPEIVDVVLTPEDGGTFLVEVTVSSPYDTPERYADGWRVLDPDGTVLAEHTLAHDHANEQPFTRSDPGVAIPDGVEQVTVEGRDLCNGYGGATFDAPVPPA